jgi:hypothetical protein
MCTDGLLDMTRGYDRKGTFQVHSATESRLKYKYGEVLRLKNDSNFRGSIATEDTNKTHMTMCLPNDRGNHQDTYKCLMPTLPSKPCSTKLTADYEPGSSNLQSFRAVWCSMWIRDIHHNYKDIAGLSQVTWAATHRPPNNPFSIKKIHTHTHTCLYVCVSVCVCVRACELPLRTF